MWSLLRACRNTGFYLENFFLNMGEAGTFFLGGGASSPRDRILPWKPEKDASLPILDITELTIQAPWHSRVAISMDSGQLFTLPSGMLATGQHCCCKCVSQGCLLEVPVLCSVWCDYNSYSIALFTQHLSLILLWWRVYHIIPQPLHKKECTYMSTIILWGQYLPSHTLHHVPSSFTQLLSSAIIIVDMYLFCQGIVEYYSRLSTFWPALEPSSEPPTEMST